MQLYQVVLQPELCCHPFTKFDQLTYMMINADNWSKVLRVSHDTIAKRNGGHMVNLLSTDAEKLFWFVQYLAFIIVSPMQVAIIAWLCYQRIGTPSIIGLIIIILVVPLQGLKIMFLTISNYY